MASYNTEPAYEPKVLLASDNDITTRKRTLAAGTIYEQGTVLGKVTASGHFTLCDKTANDGRENALEILGETTDATDGAVEAITYTSGDFRKSELILADGTSPEDVEEELHLRGITIR
jgi:hypothetical protein